MEKETAAVLVSNTEDAQEAVKKQNAGDTSFTSFISS